MRSYKDLQIEIDRLMKRAETLDGALKSSRLRNDKLSTVHKNLRNEICAIKKEINALKMINNDFEKELKSIKDTIRTKSLIAKDVENSSIPSSSNVYKKKVSNSRTKSGKPKGGQVGHKGHSLEYLKPTSVTTINHKGVGPKCGTLLNH